MQRFWASLLLVSFCLLPVAAQPPGPPPKQPRLLEGKAETLRNGKILLNYEDVDIRLMGRLMAELTGRNVVFDQNVQGKLTVLSAREVTPEEAWQIFKVALERYGFGVYERAGFTQVVPLKDARMQSPVLVNPKGGIPTDMALAVLLFKNADVNILQNTIRPLLSEVGQVQPYQPGQALIIVDKAPIVKQVASIARTIDVAHPEMHTSVVYPKYARAEQLVPVIDQLLNRPGITNEARVQVRAFEAANAVVTQGTKQQILEVKRLLSRLDIPSAAPEDVQEPKFYVYQLQHAQAEDVAKILSEMLSEKQALQEQRLRENPQALRQQAAAQPNGAAPDAANPNGAAPNTATGTAGEKVPFVSAKVASDPETNSLILYVSPSQYDEVAGLVKVLDAPRRQVLVTAVVAEVTLNRVLETGAAFQVLTNGGVVSTFKGGLSEEGLLSYLASGNFILGAVGSGSRTINVNGRDVDVPELFAFLSGQKNNSDFNLISAPRIMTEDHKEAEMNVGNVVPFATGAQFNNFGQPTITYDYRDVGIKMKVTPHVSQSDSIRLELDQEIQEVTDFLQQDLGGFGYVVPLISNRNVKTTVTVKDGQTLLIGGLISKRTTETMTKVPLLGDIPLIQNFFRELRKEEAKTTLFIALTPHIVERPDEIKRLDRPYQKFLKGDQNPRDHQPEVRETEQKEDFVSPYDSAPAPPPVRLRPDDNGSMEQSNAGVQLISLRMAAPPMAGEQSHPVVTLRNGSGRGLELVLIGTVRAPDGTRTELKSDSIRLTSGQSREVSLPPYEFGGKGVYEFDVSAWEREDLVGRLPLPQKVQLK
ncbi:MAG: type II secretion system secretin GspD [Candidatus Eremiobacteraeota bacterium]|nr:type II secretion system secretin GspD [Candidatus Eremiobacteraeota bacterium]